MNVEVCFAAAYALGLALVAGGLERMALRTERDAVEPAATGCRRRRQTGPSQNDPSFAHLNAARFHRGLALVVCLCALYILIVFAVRHPAWSSRGVLAAAAAAPGCFTWGIARRFFMSRFGSPTGGR